MRTFLNERSIKEVNRPLFGNNGLHDLGECRMNRKAKYNIIRSELEAVIQSVSEFKSPSLALYERVKIINHVSKKKSSM